MGAEKPPSRSRDEAGALPLLQKQFQAKSEAPHDGPVGLLPPPHFPGRVHSGVGDHALHRGLMRGDLHSPSKGLPLAAAPPGCTPTQSPQLSVSLLKHRVGSGLSLSGDPQLPQRHRSEHGSFLGGLLQRCAPLADRGEVRE